MPIIFSCICNIWKDKIQYLPGIELIFMKINFKCWLYYCNFWRILNLVMCEKIFAYRGIDKNLHSSEEYLLQVILRRLSYVCMAGWLEGAITLKESDCMTLTSSQCLYIFRDFFASCGTRMTKIKQFFGICWIFYTFCRTVKSVKKISINSRKMDYVTPLLLVPATLGNVRLSQN